MEDKFNSKPMEDAELYFVNKYLVRNKYGVWFGNPVFDEEQVKAAVETEILPAALQGNRGAVQCLLTMNGDAVDEAFEKIQDQIEKLAEEGDLHCQCYIANELSSFYNEWGVLNEEHDNGKKLVRYLKNVAENHDEDVERERARVLLWMAFSNGYGVKKDLEEAAKWFDYSEDNFQAFLDRLVREGNDRSVVS